MGGAASAAPSTCCSCGGPPHASAAAPELRPPLPARAGSSRLCAAAPSAGRSKRKYLASRAWERATGSPCGSRGKGFPASCARRQGMRTAGAVRPWASTATTHAGSRLLPEACRLCCAPAPAAVPAPEPARRTGPPGTHLRPGQCVLHCFPAPALGIVRPAGLQILVQPRHPACPALPAAAQFITGRVGYEQQLCSARHCRSWPEPRCSSPPCCPHRSLPFTRGKARQGKACMAGRTARPAWQPAPILPL